MVVTFCITEGKLYCHEQSALKLAAYSLQAEIGDKKDTDAEMYFHAEKSLPSRASFYSRNDFVNTTHFFRS